MSHHLALPPIGSVVAFWTILPGWVFGLEKSSHPSPMLERKTVDNLAQASWALGQFGFLCLHQKLREE